MIKTLSSATLDLQLWAARPCDEPSPNGIDEPWAHGVLPITLVQSNK